VTLGENKVERNLRMVSLCFFAGLAKPRRVIEVKQNIQAQYPFRVKVPQYLACEDFLVVEERAT
jgi:hypothetical protein